MQNAEWRKMETLKWSDQRKIAEFVRGLYGLNSVQVIAQQVVQGMDALIGCNSPWVVHTDRRIESLNVWAENVGADLFRLASTAWALRHEHPGIRYHHIHRGRAVAIADLVPLRQWKKAGIYNEVFSKLGMQEQLAASFPFAFPDMAGVILNRTRRTFTQRDRIVLDILRFHISEACKTAKMHAAIPSPELVDMLESLVGGNIIILDTTGTVQFCSDIAQDCLKAFFPKEKPFNGVLPLTVETWVRREIAAFGTDKLAVRLPQPLNVLRGDRSLNIRLASTRNRTVHFLVLRSEDPISELKKLSALGLGSRATEVLYWLAKGKTNGEIGIILGARPRTIEKHVEGILGKLGVENRVAAALVATNGGFDL
jgi:DNA-binding CsgD family transcriptional regulator